MPPGRRNKLEAAPVVLALFCTRPFLLSPRSRHPPLSKISLPHRLFIPLRHHVKPHTTLHTKFCVLDLSFPFSANRQTQEPDSCGSEVRQHITKAKAPRPQPTLLPSPMKLRLTQSRSRLQSLTNILSFDKYFPNLTTLFFSVSYLFCPPSLCVLPPAGH